VNLETTRDSNVLAAVEALGGTFDAPKMTPHARPLPPLPPMQPVGPKHVSGTGKPGDPFMLDDEARKARRARMLAIVAGARYPGDHPEEEDR
jgi:hypothetical protein